MKHSLIVIVSTFMLSLLTACSSENRNGTYIGYVEAEYVYVAAPQSGWLANAPVREGDEIAAGEILFELDKDQQVAMVADAAGRAAQADAQMRDIGTGARPAEIEELEAQRSEAKARLAQAKSERDRWMPLVKEGNASKARGDQVTADYQSALARVKAAEEAIIVAKLGGRDAAQEAAGAAASSAKAGLAQAEWQLGQRTVRAKVSGQIEDVYHRQGEFVMAGAPVVAMLPPRSLKVRFFVPQAALPGFSIGSEVSVTADGIEAPLTAKINYIANEAEFTPPVIYSVGSREKLVFLVEARLTDAGEEPRLRPGLPVDVRLAESQP